jgi:hypothetical protein
MQYRLNAWPRCAVAPEPHQHMGPMLIYVYCVCHIFQCLNTDFVGSTITINMFNFIGHLHFFPASGCVCMGPSALISRGLLCC